MFIRAGASRSTPTPRPSGFRSSPSRSVHIGTVIITGGHGTDGGTIGSNVRRCTSGRRDRRRGPSGKNWMASDIGPSPVNPGIKGIARPPPVTIAFRVTRAQCRRSVADTRARPEPAKAARPRQTVALIKAPRAAPRHRRIAFLRTRDGRRPRNRPELRRRRTRHRRRCDVQARRSRRHRPPCTRADRRAAGKRITLRRVTKATAKKVASRRRSARRAISRCTPAPAG